MKTLIDLTGKVFTQLTVTNFSHSLKVGKQTKRFWSCICSCGNTSIVSYGSLTSNRTKSCGCRQLAYATKHGKFDTKEYQAWKDIKQRCLNKNHRSYDNYGGRGIKICDEWINSFYNFYKDMGDSFANGWIERIDNNGNYCKENCKWADRNEQQNNRQKTIKITFDGKSLSLAQWARELGINKQVLYERKKAGWPIELMLSPIFRKGIKGIGVTIKND